MSGPLMLDLAGTELLPEEARMIAAPQVGGIIFFARNYRDPVQIDSLVKSIRAVRHDIILAVDQEGGRVQRFRDGFTRLPPLRYLGHLYDENSARAIGEAREWGWLMAAEMRAFDIDISFAPVLDLDYGRSQVIGNRAFHHAPGVVAELAAAYIDGMAEAGMAATGKHFPGHGWVQADSHHAIPVDERELDSVSCIDMVPFARLAARLRGIMPAHVIFERVTQHPAGFSSYWLQDILRAQLGYRGVIFSDDLTMEGASVAGGYVGRAQAALKAGADMVLVCNNRAGALEVLEWLQGEISSENPAIAALRGLPFMSMGELKSTARWHAVVASMNDVSVKFGAQT